MTKQSAAGDETRHDEANTAMAAAEKKSSAPEAASPVPLVVPNDHEGGSLTAPRSASEDDGA